MNSMQIGDSYARFYPPLAVVLPVLSAFPPYHDQHYDGLVDRYGTLYHQAGMSGGGPAQFGLALLFVMVGLLALATLIPRSVKMPAAIAGIAVLGVIMLVEEPGIRSPKPGLTDIGVAGVVLLIVTAVICAAHAIHLAVLGRFDSTARGE